MDTTLRLVRSSAEQGAPPDRGHERAQVERSGLLVASGERQGIREPHFAISSDDHLQNSPMQRLLASVTIVLLLGMVITRVLLMRRSGIRAMHFGQIDKKDFLIPPFAFFYFYIVFAAAFGLPTVSQQQFFYAEALSWVGVFLCVVGLLLFLLSLVSFGRSFRVGIDADHPDNLITTGLFALPPNPTRRPSSPPLPGH